MRMLRLGCLPVVVSALLACGDDASSSGGGGSGAGGPGSGAGGVGAGAQGGAGQGGGDGGGGGVSSCESFGHWPAPENTFTLPDGDLYYPDIQASFPEVDWSTLDRLYIPAGTYSNLNIGNLPERSADRPLIITNQGGQVKVGPNLGGNFIWAMGGGSNWILTGRYDPDAQTGDEAFQGHRCGAYASSRGQYGFLSDDAFDFTGAYLHMGVAVGDATDFEIEYVEVTRSGFAGFRFLNEANGDPSKPMANVKLHDTYVHDVAGEGIYLGWTGSPPSNLLPGLQVYNNRFVRTGNEALQIQNLGDGSHVHHNAIVHAGLHWRDNGLGAYQDHNSQINMRENDVVVENNVFIGSAAPLLSFWRGEEAGDAPLVAVLRNNYFAETRAGFAGYFGGAASAASTYLVEGNRFRNMDFFYDQLDPAATDRMVLFGVNNGVDATITFQGNVWEGDEQLVSGIPENGSSGNVTATGNAKGTVAPIAFVDALEVSGTNIEFWVASSPLAAGNPPRTYQVGEVVLHVDGNLYRAIATSTALVPPEHPEAWEVLPTPADDYRVVTGSEHDGLGPQ